MFGIGLPELILIMVVALVVIGPKKLPDVAKALGRAMGEFRRATSDFKEAIDLDEDLRDLKNVKDSITDIKDEVRSKISFDDITKGLSGSGNADKTTTAPPSETSGNGTPEAADTLDDIECPEEHTAEDTPSADQKEPDPNARG